MKATCLLTFALLCGAFANADYIIGESYTSAMGDGRGCDIAQIPTAAQTAVDAAITKANKVCENPSILEARILSVDPVACRSWTGGFHAKAAVEFSCGH